LGEHVHNLFQPADQAFYHRWNSGYWTDAQLAAYYYPNASRKVLRLDDPTGRDYIAMNPGSDHPGGANVAFADGTVHFRKDTIDCWPVAPSTLLAVGVVFNADGNKTVQVTSAARVGVFQALASRASGEVIARDAF